MRTLPLIVTLFASAACLVAQDVTGRHFRRETRLPQTPKAEASEAGVQAAEASAGRRYVRPLQRLRSGRAWPKRHFSRLPAPRPVAPERDTRAVDASTLNRERRWLPAPARRGFWRARR